jgi:hypothetical protein
VLRTIPELVARYKLEPSIRDVFVEGRTDVQLIGRVLRASGLRDVIPYEIRTVDIPPRDLVAGGYEDGAKGRVLYLAFEFDRALPPRTRAVSCVADRDYDYLLGKIYTSTFLLFVDYSCSEMYAFDEPTLDEVIRCVQPSHPKPAGIIIAALSVVLGTLFTLRATNIQLGLGLSWLESFTDDCAVNGEGIDFDLESFLTRYLNTRGKIGRRQAFLVAFTALRAILAPDHRFSINGHDLVALLAWYLRQHSKKSNPLLRPEVLHHLLLAHADPIRISEEPFFRSLAERVGSQPAQP